MARSKDLKVVIAGDADKLDRELRKSSGALDKFGKQTRITSSVTSKGFAGIRATAVGATAALGGLAIAGKSVVEAALESEKSQAKLEAQLKASGVSYKAHADEIDRVIRKHSQLAAVDDEDLQAAFTTLVRSSGSATTAMRDLGVVTDLARAKNIDVGKAAEQVGKIYAGSTGPLTRMGIEFVKTTTNVDKLRESTKKITPEQMAAAKAADRQANATRALGLLQDKVGGQAKAYGDTTQGSLERANIAWENLRETVGLKLLPTVTDAADKLGTFVNEMQDGTGQGGRFVDTLKEIWAEIRPIVTGMGRAARAIGQFAAEHPSLLKLAGGIAAVGLAVKAMRFVSAVTGFSALLKGGRAAARGLHRIMSGAGESAGSSAAANLASTFRAKGRSFSAAGRNAGTAIGRGVRGGLLAGVTMIGDSFVDKLIAKIKGAFGEKIGGVIQNLIEGAMPGGRPLREARKWLQRQLGLQTGGKVPGTGRGDVVPAMLEPGEFVIRRKVVERFGPTFFADLNGSMGEGGPRFANGGIVALGRSLQREGYQVGEHPQFGGVGRHVPNSYHYRGMALDINGGPGGEPGSLDRLANRLRGKPGVVELLWRTAGHYDHLHVAVSGDRSPLGGSSRGGSSGSVSDAPTAAELAAQRREAAERRREAAERAGSRLVNRITAPFAGRIRRATSGAARLGTQIEDAGTRYGQTERMFGLTDEDLGTAAGRARRVSELGELAKLKKKTLSNQKRRAQYLKRAIRAYDAQLKKLRAARDKAKGAKRSKMNDRMRPIVARRDDLAAEAKALGEAIVDTHLDIGDLAKEAGQAAATPDTPVEAGPSAAERAEDLLSLVDLRERAGVISPAEAAAQREAVRGAALGGALGPLTERERLAIMADLRDATSQATEAMNVNTQALQALQAEIAKQNAINESIVGVSLREAQRALADMISGQLGVRTANRAMLPGTGQLARL